jgi:hypothetical protein
VREAAPGSRAPAAGGRAAPLDRLCVEFGYVAATAADAAQALAQQRFRDLDG